MGLRKRRLAIKDVLKDFYGVLVPAAVVFEAGGTDCKDRRDRV